MVGRVNYLSLPAFNWYIFVTQHNGRTPLMEVVRSNMLDMVKVLIYATDDRAVWETKDTTDVDLSLQDNDGKSVIHHCVQNRKVRTKSNLVTGYFFNCLFSVVTRIPCPEVNVLHLNYPLFVETIVFLV